MRVVLLAAVWMAGLFGGWALAEIRPQRSLFDPARHMPVAEVKAGMKGYGLSVFQGTTIERFDVEVLSVLKNFNPKHDVILVRLSGANLEHSGAIAGMSGSPIFLRDEQGRSRMAGAFAYGWPNTKDPVGGVQPIEYMLDLRKAAEQPAPPRPATRAPTDAASSVRRPWHVGESIILPGSKRILAAYPFDSWNGATPNPAYDRPGPAALRPLMMPLQGAGFPESVRRQLAPLFERSGLMMMQAGAGASGDAATRPAAGDLEPGGVLAVPLLTGDFDLTAIGTVTEVLDGQVFGFGHSFLSEGAVTLPMGFGRIDGVIANLETSFKLGTMIGISGTLLRDETVGIFGRMGGEPPPTVPVEIRVTYADGSQDQTFKFSSAVHPRLTPLVCAAAMAAAVTGEHDLPQHCTLDYGLSMTFANGQTLQIDNRSSSPTLGELFYELGSPMIAAADNPFEEVAVREVRGTVVVSPAAQTATVLSVNVPRRRLRPGETVKAFVAFRPFRAADATLPITFDLPKDLPEGDYRLVISDWERYLADEQTAKPFRFVAESAGEVFDVLRYLASVRHDGLYVRLVRDPDGVAVGRTAMPRLPSSRREVFLGAGRSNTAAFVSSDVRAFRTPYVMSGAAEFVISVDKQARVEEIGPARPNE